MKRCFKKSRRRRIYPQVYYHHTYWAFLFRPTTGQFWKGPPPLSISTISPWVFVFLKLLSLNSKQTVLVKIKATMFVTLYCRFLVFEYLVVGSRSPVTNCTHGFFQYYFVLFFSWNGHIWFHFQLVADNSFYTGMINSLSQGFHFSPNLLRIL